ncbi:MAG TPA: formyltetrahydrofolate deformylase, partial [Acidimicrobiales bacterium]|nr:formyltetrahydrofolate deformylase [Acidimicrobiales bacterium]
MILTMSCPDRVGVVAAVTGFVAEHDGWVLEAAQHGDLETGTFFQRIEILAEGFGLDLDTFGQHFADVADAFGLDWHLTDSEARKRVVICVSRESHCLVDLLHRWSTGDLHCDVVGVVSNHADLEELSASYRVPFFCVPIPAEDRQEGFARFGRLLDDLRPDVVVLARYMQIVPAAICERFAGRILNIHHSFLPSFAGARPYHQAFARGVKVIGATAHYVTAELDAGPIIHQDVAHISHKDGVNDMIRIGREVERRVLAQAVRW